MKRTLCALLWLALLLPVCIAAALPAQAAGAENLVRGMEYTIENSLPTAYSYSNFSEGGTKFDVDNGQLTDGARAQGGPSDSAWYRAFRSHSRYVTFAFDAPVAVTGMSAGFYHGAGYQAPRYVKLYLSNNGSDWFLAGETSPSFAQNASAQRYNASLTVEPYAAQYVRVEFCCDIFTCCDEIEVYGSRKTDGTERTFTPDAEGESFYCTGLDGDSYGISDIIKLYNGYYPPAQDRINNTVEKLLPYVAYLAQDGTIQDTMFDAVAFVPCVTTDAFSYPSGGSLVKTSKYPPAVQSDWILYTDFLFAEGYELDALNDAVEQVYTALGKGKDEKFPVLLTMPYPGVMSKPFGDLDGDGVQENCSTDEERIAVVKWYNDYLSKRFAEAGFSRLDFVGYYWYQEEMNESWSTNERAFTSGALEALKQAGKQVLFDPFYLSVGFDSWQSLGFSGAVMQPNVAFTSDRSYFELDMLWEFAEAIGKYHLGVEIETNEPSFFQGDASADACYNYERYLYVGWKTGYMDALHTFYQGAGPGALYDFCHADTKQAKGIRLRRLYDCTYAFIKNRYENLPPVVELTNSFNATSGERCTIPLTVTDEDSFPGEIRAEVIECGHGRAQVTANRASLVYIPDEDFTGEDTIVVEVSDGHNPAERFTVTARVYAPGEMPEGSGTLIDYSGTVDPKDSTQVWLFLLLGGIGIVGITTIVVIVVLKRRKRA